MAAKGKKSTALARLPAQAPEMASAAGSPPQEFPGMSYAELASFSRENIEAAVKTNAALSAGLEAIGQEVMIYARTALKAASETAHGLLSARTLEDVVRLQTDLAKRNLDGLVAGSVKLSEIGVSLASETFAPWEGRVEAVMAHFTYPQSGKSPSP
jgi:phasin family protein